MPGEREQQHFQADQDKENRVQDFIDQFPKRIQMLPGFVRHPQHPTVIPHQQPGHDNGQGAGQVERTGQRIAAGHRGEGEQHFDVIVVDAFEQPIGQIAQSESKDEAAHGFLCEQANNMGHGGFVRAGRQFGEDEKHHDADAIVKERFSGNLHG